MVPIRPLFRRPVARVATHAALVLGAVALGVVGASPAARAAPAPAHFAAVPVVAPLVVHLASASLAVAPLVTPDDDLLFGQRLLLEGADTETLVADLDGDGHLDVFTGDGSGFLHWGTGDGTFEPLAAAPVSGYQTVAGDLDGDGLLDLVVSGAGSHRVALNLGDRAFATQFYGTGISPSDLALADMDLDGDLDLLRCEWFDLQFGGRVDVLLGDGAGGVSLTADFDLQLDDPDELAVADLDADGDPDVVAADDPRVAVLLNGGDGSLALHAHEGPFGFDTDTVALADLDGDGLLDLVAGGRYSGSARVTVWPGEGAAFGASSTIDLGPGGFIRDVEPADADGDGVPDLLVADSSLGGLTLLPGTGDGGFGPASLLPAGELVFVSRAADLDADGAPDLLIADGDHGMVHLVFGDGDGGFVSGPPSSPAPSAGLLQAGDIDDDGLVDLLVVDRDTEAVHVLRADGAGGFATAGSSAHGPGNALLDGTLADLDLDGDLDLATAMANVGSGGTLVLYENLGGGVFGPATPTALPSAGRAIGGFDVDEDGFDDLVLATTDPVFVVRGNAALSVALEPVPGASISAGSLTWGDVHGDGETDVLIQRSSSGGGPSTLLLPGLDGGLFGPGLQPFGAFVTVTPQRLADLDADGRADWVAPYGSQGRIELRAAVGDGHFTTAPMTVPLWDPLGVWLSQGVAADLDGDGVSDLAAASGADGGAVSVVRGDGAFGFSPPDHHFAGWTTEGLAALDVDGDGLLDLVASGTAFDGTAIVSVLTHPAPPTWCDLGQGLAGTHGVPRLSGLGELTAGSAVALRVTDALAASPTWLVLGFGLLEQPFKGGTLVPAPDLVVGGLLTDVDGDLLLPSLWPAGVPSGLSFHAQAWIADPAGPKGLAATNGLTGTAD